MGFEQMDAYEKTYVDCEKPKVEEVKVNNLQFHEPENAEEKEIAKKIKEHLLSATNRAVKMIVGILIILGIVGIVMNIAMDMWLEEVLVILCLPVFVLICLLIYELLKRKSIASVEAEVTKVMVFDRFYELHSKPNSNTNFHKIYYFRILQQETQLVVNRLPVSKEEYDSFSTTKMIYLIKLGKNIVTQGQS